jgi:tetratricopeptide (TPR) repeat protein
MPPPGQAMARAAALIDIGRTADAIPLLHQAIAQDPQNDQARCLLSVALFRERQYWHAEEAARGAIAAAPEHGWGWALRAVALKEMQLRPDALKSAQHAVELEPTNPDRYNVLVQVALGWRTDLAREASVVLLQLAPQASLAHYRAGTVAMISQQNHDAELCFRRALAIDPAFAAAHNDLGVVLLREGKRTEALDAFQRAATLNPADQVAAKNIAVIARRHKLPLPSWARRGFLIGPGLVVAMFWKFRHRHELDALPESARREVTRWSRSDWRRLGGVVGIGVASLVVIGIIAVSIVVAGLHPPPQAPTEPVNQTTSKQLVCALVQGATYVEGIVAGVDSAATSVDAAGPSKELGTEALETAQLIGAGTSGSEFKDLTAMSSDATALSAALDADASSTVATDEVQLQTDSAAVGIDAGC